MSRLSRAPRTDFSHGTSKPSKLNFGLHLRWAANWSLTTLERITQKRTALQIKVSLNGSTHWYWKSAADVSCVRLSSSASVDFLYPEAFSNYDTWKVFIPKCSITLQRWEYSQIKVLLMYDWWYIPGVRIVVLFSIDTKSCCGHTRTSTAWHQQTPSNDITVTDRKDTRFHIIKKVHRSCILIIKEEVYFERYKKTSAACFITFCYYSSRSCLP